MTKSSNKVPFEMNVIQSHLQHKNSHNITIGGAQVPIAILILSLLIRCKSRNFQRWFYARSQSSRVVDTISQQFHSIFLEPIHNIDLVGVE